MDLFNSYANLFNGKILSEFEVEKENIFQQELAYIEAERACTELEPVSAIDIDMNYVTSGMAYFTVSNNKGDSYSFRVLKSKTKYFVSILNGVHITYMCLWTPGKPLYFGGKTNHTADSIPAKVFAWALKVIQGKVAIPEGYSILRLERVLNA